LLLELPVVFGLVSVPAELEPFAGALDCAAGADPDLGVGAVVLPLSLCRTSSMTLSPCSSLKVQRLALGKAARRRREAADIANAE
jgi:hypothetical protein